ncbi:MAG: hypothetical protein ACPL7B_17875 [Candidatus Poribacteria bacterium]
MRSKVIAIFIVIAFLYPSSIYADFQHKKTLGKFAMVVILSLSAFINKKLVDKDVRKTARIRQELATPDKAMEFQDGFDKWRIEWYGNTIYVFKNGIFYYKRNLED